MTEWKILLVDDEIAFRSTLAERLRMRGLRVEEAGSGEEAFRMIEVANPQVIVLDVVMPGPSGFQVLKRLKAEYPNIPVIMLTGIGTPREAAMLGAHDYLLKPVPLEILVEKIGKAVEEASRSAGRTTNS